jgi:hypothetical protein
MAWSRDNAFLVFRGWVGGSVYAWPSLKLVKDYSLENEAPSTGNPFYSNGNPFYLENPLAGEHPLASGAFGKGSWETPAPRFRLKHLLSHNVSSGEAMAAVPAVEPQSPGEIRRFIEPFLDWFEKPDDGPALVSLRTQLHMELLDRSKNTSLPQEWRDLLLWWTTKPGERKPLYQ